MPVEKKFDLNFFNNFKQLNESSPAECAPFPHAAKRCATPGARCGHGIALALSSRAQAPSSAWPGGLQAMEKRQGLGATRPGRRARQVQRSTFPDLSRTWARRGRQRPRGEKAIAGATAHQSLGARASHADVMSPMRRAGRAFAKAGSATLSESNRGHVRPEQHLRDVQRC